MIPILFEESTTVFTSNGLGRIADAVECKVTEERNGVYELQMKYPTGGKMYKDLVVGRIIYATHDESKVPQPFEIYKVSAVLNDMVTVNAQHISYKLTKQTVLPFTAVSCVDAMQQIKANVLHGTDFTFWTDKSVSKNYKLEIPKTVRSVLGGEENSILDVYGKGEYEFDMFAVKLYLNRGSDNGVTIRYGKNLISLEKSRDKTNVFNAVVPYYYGEDGTIVTLPEWAVYGQGNTRQLRLITRQGDLLANAQDLLVDYAEMGIVPLDLTSEWETPPTVAQLRARANKYLTDNEPWVIDENIKIDFVQLWQTEEYANVAPLQRIRLCDWVHVYVPSMDITAKAECISVTYDTLNERYTEMELGKAKTTFAQVIAEVSEKNILPKVVTTSNMNQAIYSVTQKILGGGESYAHWTMLNGELSELTFSDQPGLENSTFLLRINRNGIGFSVDGGRTFRTAWTIDGQFVADFITAGTLSADLIKAGVLSDHAGKNTWDMASGVLTTKTIKITDLMTVNAGIGSSFRMPISEDGEDYFQLKNTSPQFEIVVKQNWGGYYRISIDATDGLKITDGDWTTTVKPDGVKITNPLMNNTSAEFAVNRLRITDGSGNASEISLTGISTTGTKNRIVDGKLFYCYETPVPYFGDIGEARVGSNEEVIVPIDSSFIQAIQKPYQVFLQPYGKGEIWVEERADDYFKVRGTAGTSFAWEIKGKQFDYEVKQ